MSNPTGTGNILFSDGSKLVIRVAELVPADVTPPPPPPPPPPPTGAVLFGAAGPNAADGSFARWLASGRLDAAATWNNGNDEQVGLYTLKAKGDAGGTGEFFGWPDKLLDVAIGAVDKLAGESWSAAAGGSYDSRWTASWLALRKAWGGRTASNLHVRFAHEFNGDWMKKWRVMPGEQAAFVAAFRRWAALGARLFPGAVRVWCPNDGTSGGLADIALCWPGKDAADVYSVDTYNAWPWVNDTGAWQQKITSPGGIEWHRLRAAGYGVPLAISEWANNGTPKPQSQGGGGESPFYVQAMHNWCIEHGGSGPGQVKYALLFNLWPQYQLMPATVQPLTAARYREIF